ncbi:MAG: helix-turn-helix transcriptional regulator, partial [Ignavibacteriaceae bacterium]
QAAGDFIRNFRLKRAANLLKGRHGNIGEIAYDVGFNNPSYFSECFKKLFGVLPSEYVQESANSSHS